MIETKALGPSTRAGGRLSNFSISGKLMSTWGFPDLRRASIRSGSLCKVWGPKTRSTYGARATIASPSWLATQPPTPIRSSGRSFFRAFTRPRSWNTFSWAFSRTEQVLNRIRSASSGRSVGSNPCAARSMSAILTESYSFIWQPNVRTKSFFVTSAARAARLGLGELLRREQPRAEQRSVRVQDVVRCRAAGRNGHRHDDQVLLVADLGAGCELHRPLVDGDRHFLEMANHPSLGL